MKYGISAALVILALNAGCQSTSSTPDTSASTSAPDSRSNLDAPQPQVKIAADPERSGFLPPYIYDRLTESQQDKGVKAWVDATRDWRAFNKILFEPTEVYLTPNPEYTGMPREALLRMTSDFQNAFIAAVQPDYMVVSSPGPDVLRVKTAITGVQPTSPKLGVTDFIPIKAVFNLTRKAVGKAPQVAEMSAELQVLAPSGDVVAAATATRKGDERLPQGEEITWGDMQSIADYWAQNFKHRLDGMRGVSSQKVGQAQ
jgi:ABC-type Fe3+-hydroxamate transport system substrate-binding protein